MVQKTKEESYLVVYFKKVLRRKNGRFRDDSGSVIPEDLISFRDKYYIMFKEGWQLVARNDYFEVIYPNASLIFSEGNVRDVVVNY